MRQLTELKARRIEAGDKPVADGIVAGLRLEPGTSKGRGKWILRFVSPVTGKRRDMGLGSYPEIGIGDARQFATAARRTIAGGRDPITKREVDKAKLQARDQAETFEQAARDVHDKQREGWKNSKHANQWINTLCQYVFPKIGRSKVDELVAADFAAVLRPIWLSKPETASRVRQRCHRVMDACVARGLLTANPVGVVDHLLPNQVGKRKRTHHQPAMPWRAVPAFAENLRAGSYSVTRALLEFVILTAARSGEARAMTWAEVDLTAKIWTVPAGRMKAKVVHRVPLSDRPVEILKDQRVRSATSTLVFPSPRGLVLCDMALTKFLRDQNAVSADPVEPRRHMDFVAASETGRRKTGIRAM